MVAFSRVLRERISSSRSVMEEFLVFCVAEDNPHQAVFQTAVRLQQHYRSLRKKRLRNRFHLAVRLGAPLNLSRRAEPAHRLLSTNRIPTPSRTESPMATNPLPVGDED